MEQAMKVMIKLRSSDGMEYEVEEHTAEQSAFIRGLMMFSDARENGVTISDVKGSILAKVMDYCKKHAETADHVELDCWDAEFVNVENHILYDFIMAALALTINSLLRLCCKKVAQLIKGLTADEIREIFNIQNDFTPEEAEAVRRENLWEF
ncbi:SKP1-like protein 1 [Dioscorea cayenensis subsp. rotundata]|uniref:SKP1-like protein n=1 Tax=Dioscorea cayennensis subsp. rotundata TaxID=55577 RepID=A0AB40C6N3_DIOCR|nr:SKP1-like protein 1 [Dioscorea cayenensis subsp. rotundata]